MAQFSTEWLEHQRRRFMRPDAYRWLPPGHPDYDGPQPYGRKSSPDPSAGPGQSQGAAAVPEVTSDAELQDQRLALATLRLDWELLKLALKGRKAGFNPDQPRDDDGRWSDAGGGQSTSLGSDGSAGQGSPIRRLALVLRICILSGASRITDAFGNKTYSATYECRGGRFLMREGIGHSIPGLVRDPLR